LKENVDLPNNMIFLSSLAYQKIYKIIIVCVHWTALSNLFWYMHDTVLEYEGLSTIDNRKKKCIHHSDELLVDLLYFSTIIEA
jgi:hypothetical protein